MSQKLTESDQKTLSWEDSIPRFLEENPDYFQDRPELLESLQLFHTDKGCAVSLIERQVQQLRNKNQLLSRQLQDLIEIARENDRLNQRLHRFALAMVESSGLDDALDRAREILTQDFGLEYITIYTERAANTGLHWSDSDNEIFKGLMSKIFPRSQQSWKPVYGDMVSGTAKMLLFGESEDQINSCAMIPLGKKPDGVLALGSTDAQRFNGKLGTAYLSRLGELMTQVVARHSE